MSALVPGSQTTDGPLGNGAEAVIAPREKALTIGAVRKTLAKEFGDISISKIRYLEDQKLLTPKRTQGGYRVYTQDDVARLRTILRLQRDEYLPLRVIRQELSAGRSEDIRSDDILCLGDGIHTDIEGAMGESLDAVFVTGGLAAEETGTSVAAGPDPAHLEAYLARARMAPLYAMAYRR